MNNKMKKWSILYVALMVLFSCSQDMDVEPIIDPDNGTDNEVTLRLQMPGHIKPNVYAASEEDENAVNELDVLAFAKQNATTDTLAYRITVSGDQITNAQGGEHGNIKDINIRFKRNESELKLVLIANAGDIIDNAGINPGDPFSDINDKLIYGINQKWSTSPMTAIPMWGQTDGYLSIKNPVILEPVHVTLLRAVAKVDVGVDVYGDPSIGFGKRFELKHVYVYNANNKGTVIPDPADLGLADNKVTKPTVPSSASVLPVQEYTITETPFYNEIYLAESDKSSDNHTFLVIGASYDKGPETYYRIDFVNNAKEKLDLLRNHRYLVNITNVGRDGFQTKEAAAAANSSNIDFSLGVTDENINSIVYNGQYVLGVSTNQMSHDWYSTGNITLSVATDYPSGWEASTEDSWITLTTSNGGTNGNLVYKLSENNDDSQITRAGKIRLTAGSLVQEVIVMQSLGANSYIVAPNATIQISALFANADGTKRVTSGMSLVPELLWQEDNAVINTYSISGTTLTVNSGNKSGNAVIAVKSGNKILWSWHIWVTNYNPHLNTSQNSYNGTIFMDRNLGAIANTTNTSDSYGLLYQWGRKDPFPGASSVNSDSQRTIVNQNGQTVAIAVEEVSQSNNFENAIQNPMTFYISNAYPWYNWYGLDVANSSLWIDAQGNKTVYDPCPHGWRVANTPEVWSGLNPTNTSNGFTLPSVGFYPGTGSLDFSTGKLIEAGNSGYYWTAAASGVRAKAMRLDASGISLQSTPFRASGYPVRCVKE